MREALSGYCTTTVCHKCILGKSYHRCGDGTHFLKKNGEGYDMKDEEIMDAYAKVFPTPKSDMVDHPIHYNRKGAMETIDEMEVLFGLESTYDFCRLNAWKYRARAQAKNGDEDMKKSDWYIRKAAELKVRMKQEGIYERRTESI